MYLAFASKVRIQELSVLHAKTSGESRTTVPPIAPQVLDVQSGQLGQKAKQPVRFTDFVAISKSDI